MSFQLNPRFCYLSETLRLFRPFARRALKTFLPPAVAIRDLKPCFLALLILLG